LEDRDEKGNLHEYKIIVTTIQKLDIFIRKNKQHDIYKKHVVLIFDECHRSQFGEMHQAITKSFKNYHIFGLRELRYLLQMPAQVEIRSYIQQNRHLEKNCIPIPLWMPLMMEMSCLLE
jgi:replicative superfamily II helicase